MHSDNGVSGVREPFFISLQFRYKSADLRSSICCPALVIGYLYLSFGNQQQIYSVNTHVLFGELRTNKMKWIDQPQRRLQPNTPKASASASDTGWLKHFKCSVPTFSCLSGGTLTSFFNWIRTNAKYFKTVLAFQLSPCALWLVQFFPPPPLPPIQTFS